MQFEDVETFLAAVDHGGIAKAAASLYIGQGTASQRIRRLETELGVTLLFRQAGVRQLSLTPEGERFLDIARQWVSLQQEAESISAMRLRRRLRVSATEMYNRYYLDGFYPAFVAANPDIELFLQTEHATETYQLVEQQRIDLGIVASVHQSPAAISMPLFEERMAVVCHEGDPFVASRDLAKLDCSREVYALWSSEFDHWHRQALPAASPLVTVGSVGMMGALLSLPGSWAFMTEHLARRAERRHAGLTAVTLDGDVIPTRTAYLVLYAAGKPWLKPVATHFIDEMASHLSGLPGVRVVLDKQ